MTYNDGVAAAKGNNKPIMVLFTQPWCGACKGLKTALQTDPVAFQKAAVDFNLVSVEGESEVLSNEASAFQKDGGYIPRVYFLKADGTPDYSINGPNDKYKYFYSSPQILLDAMKKAKRALVPSSEL